MDEARSPHVRGREDRCERPEDKRLHEHGAVQTGGVYRADDEAERDHLPEVVAVEAHRLGDELADRALARRKSDWTRLGHRRGGYRRES